MATASLPLSVSFFVLLLASKDNVASASHFQRPILSSAGFAGGGFGVSTSKSKTLPNTKKASKNKSKTGGLLEELGRASSLPSAQQSTSPKLDRFGLPIATEDDIFPPLSSDVLRTPVESHEFNREKVAEATKKHLGVDLKAFDDDGYSIHTQLDEKDSNNNGSKWKLKLLHQDPPVFQIENFFTPTECQEYMSMAKDDGSNDKNAMQISSPTFSSLAISRRTSTTWFCRYEGVATLLAKAQRLLGVDLGQVEEPQIVRYRTGEEFSWHYDEIPSTQLANGGQRLATLLVYLNDLDDGRGGGTIFRDLMRPTTTKTNDNKDSKNGKNNKKHRKGGAKSYNDNTQLTVQPTTGTALLFFPSYKDGTPDIRTLHKGEVALDKKMIAQLWIHERDYRAGVPEGNLQIHAVEKVRQEAERLGYL